MKRVLVLAGLLWTLAVGPSLAATSHGGSAHCDFAGAATCDITLNNVSTGAAIVVGALTTGSITTITASDGTNTYNQSNVIDGSGPYIGRVAACNATAGNYTITVTISDARFGSAVAHEIEGAAAASCIDSNGAGNRQTGVGIGADTVTSSASSVPSTDGAYFLGLTVNDCCSGAGISAGTTPIAYTLGQSMNDNGITSLSEYFLQTNAASIAATFGNDTAAQTFHSAVIVVKAATGGASADFYRRRFQ